MINLGYIESFKTDNKWDYTKLQEVFHVKRGDNFTLIKYKKNNSDELGLFRSVILDDNKIVCISPPKSLPYNKSLKYKIYEFVEGTMINVWFNNKWEIATKSVIGAECKFYDTQKKPFSDLFYEACEHCNFSLNKLNKNYCYSFVLFDSCI